MKINIYLIESVVNINKHLINIIFVYLHINIKKYIFFKKKIHPIKFIMKKFAWPLPPPFNFILSFYLEKIKKNRFFGSDADIYILGNNIDQKNMGESGLMESYAGR